MSRSTPRKKFSASIFPRPKAVLAALLALAPLPAATDNFSAPVLAGDPYFDLIYDYEVASFCGLIGKDVHDAFWDKRRRLEAAAERTSGMLTDVRISAMAAADLEFQNRGLGGYKPWCRKEGTEGIRRILE